MLKTIRLEEAVLRAKKLADDKLAKGENADEFVLIGEADDFRLYITAGKTVKETYPEGLHENPRDVFMLILEGQLELAFKNGAKQIFKTRECFVLPKHTKHKCVFKKMTVALEGVYEEGLWHEIKK